MIAWGPRRWLCSGGQVSCPVVHASQAQGLRPMHVLNTGSRDAVTDLLTSLKVHSSVYCLSELRSPWGFEVDGANVAKFHFVLEGSCWLRLDGHEPVLLRAGDVVVLSR